MNTPATAQPPISQIENAAFLRNAPLACRSLTRSLGNGDSRVQVLNSVNLSVATGKVYAIVGPSGCGKSTLLYLLGLLDRPDSGSIWIDGQDVSQLTDEEATYMRNQKLGFVFQFHFLIKEFSALENVLLPMMKGKKFSDSSMKDRAMHLLEQVGLDQKAMRKANQLSGGEQQRVAIARALANSPQVVLADEPTGNLDTKNSDRVFDLMKQIVHEENLSLVLVTHNPDIAESSDHVLEMRDGQFINQHDPHTSENTNFL